MAGALSPLAPCSFLALSVITKNVAEHGEHSPETRR